MVGYSGFVGFRCVLLDNGVLSGGNLDVCLILEGCIMVRAFCASLAVGYYDGNWIAS